MARTLAQLPAQEAQKYEEYEEAWWDPPKRPDEHGWLCARSRPSYRGVQANVCLCLRLWSKGKGLCSAP